MYLCVSKNESQFRQFPKYDTKALTSSELGYMRLIDF